MKIIAAIAVAAFAIAPVLAETIDENTTCATVRKVLESHDVATFSQIADRFSNHLIEADARYIFKGYPSILASNRIDYLIVTLAATCAGYPEQTLRQRSMEFYSGLRGR
jgi:hypothetical protein